MPAEVVQTVRFHVECLDCGFRSREVADEEIARMWVRQHHQAFQGVPRCKAEQASVHESTTRDGGS